jgi:hypothetical protein
MIVQLEFKTPDVLEDQLRLMTEEDREAALPAIKKFVKWGEYITIEINTETETATVLAY